MGEGNVWERLGKKTVKMIVILENRWEESVELNVEKTRENEGI